MNHWLIISIYPSRKEQRGDYDIEEINISVKEGGGD